MAELNSNTSPELSDLRERLAEYAELYLTTDLGNQRLAVACSLIEVAMYLEKVGFPAQMLLAICRPALALAERENNNALDQLFSVRKGPGAPRLTTDAHIRTGMLAVLTDAWLDLKKGDGRKHPEKIAEAARQMRGDWFSDVTPTKLKAARDLVSQESSTHPAVEYSRRFARFYRKVEETVGKRRAFPLMIRYIETHEVTRSMGISKTPPVF